jgi:hypothetical protein
MAIDHVHGRLASFERCPTALGSMVSIGLSGKLLLSALVYAVLRLQRIVNLPLAQKILIWQLGEPTRLQSSSH